MGRAHPPRDRRRRRRGRGASVIPQPKQCRVETGALPVVTDGTASLVVVLPDQPDAKETLAAEWVAKEIAAFSGTTTPIVGSVRDPAAEAKTQLVLATFDRESENLKQAAGLLDEADRELLADPKRSEQGYVIRCDERRIAIVGGSAQGTLYGAMTLLQLLQGDQAQA